MSKYRLPEIDRDATRDEVEAAFDWYRLHKYLMDDTPSMTAMYPTIDADSIRGSGGVHSNTETLAIKRAEAGPELERIERSVIRLPQLERDIITRCLMQEEPETDTCIMDSMHVGRKKFYKARSDAYYKIALFLGVAVYKKEQK